MNLFKNLVRHNHEQEKKIKDLEDKLAYFEEKKECLTCYSCSRKC